MPLARNILAVALAGLAFVPPALAQEAPRVEAARRLVEAGRYDAARDSLRLHLRTRPADHDARGLLARLLYWSRDFDSARAQYERALEAEPDEPSLLLGYADVLMAVGAYEAARRALETVRAGGGPAAIDARARLGTLAYWRGDYGAAVRHLEAVLEARPSHAEARRQLAEIRSATRPWVRGGIRVVDDSQPYRRTRGAVEAGVYLTPLWAVSGRVTPRSLDPGADGVAEGTVASGVAWLEASGYLPSVRLALRGRGGLEWSGGAREPAGAVEAAVRLGHDVELAVAGDRSRYLATASAADTLLLVDAVELGLGRETAAGWTFDAVARWERFRDGNVIRTTYAWALAPVLPGVRLGYAVSWQDADDTRWTAATGLYEPYFTPERTAVHSALLDASAAVGSLAVRMSGSYGLRATELAPTVSGPGFGPPTPGVSFYERRYTPWRLGLTVSASISDRLRLEAAGERERTAFYRATTLSASVVYMPGGPDR